MTTEPLTDEQLAGMRDTAFAEMHESDPGTHALAEDLFRAVQEIHRLRSTIAMVYDRNAKQTPAVCLPARPDVSPGPPPAVERPGAARARQRAAVDAAQGGQPSEFIVGLVVPGDPVAWARAVPVGRAMVTRKRNRDYSTVLASTARVQMRGRAPVEGAVMVDLWCILAIPASWPKTRREQAESGEIKPACFPDLDNFVKQGLDGLNGVVWRDDRQVVGLHALKLYGRWPELRIEVWTA